MAARAPDPGVLKLGNQSLGQKTGDQRRLIEPGRQQRIEDHHFDLRLFHPKGTVIGLVIQTAAGVVVAGRIRGRDAEGHTQAAGNFIQDFMFKFRECR